MMTTLLVLWLPLSLIASLAFGRAADISAEKCVDDVQSLS